MDERNLERIDRYLRNEMTKDERLGFEQEVLNDSVLRDEVELTCRIRRSLADRQRKLYKTGQWQRKGKSRTVGGAAMLSAAAMLVAAFLICRPEQTETGKDGLLAAVESRHAETVGGRSEQAVRSVRKSMEEGREEAAIEEVNDLEQHNIIPTLGDMSVGKFMTTGTETSAEAEAVCKDAYELHWLKICSLIRLGKNKEAIEALRSFVSIEGTHKKQADSLLQTLK